MFFECIDIPLAEFERHRFVKRDAGIFGQYDIGKTNLTEPDDKICCRFKICKVWEDG